MSYEESAYMDWCDKQTHKHAAHYLHFLTAYAMAIAVDNPNYTEDF